jgi:hypothetical protein
MSKDQTTSGQSQNAQGSAQGQNQGQNQQNQNQRGQGQSQQQGNVQGEEHVISATDISHSLRGINFPADLNELITQANDNNAPNDLVTLLQQFPNQQFNSMADVEHAFHRVKVR